MKRLVIMTMLSLLLSAPAAWGMDIFPDVEMTGKLSGEQRAYLGVGEGGFNLSDIKADYLLVEVFSMYCPICQRDAFKMNDVYDELSATVPGDRVKVIGIGAGNTPFEISFYAKKYEVAFPLFDDEDFVCHKALGGVGTPAFYLVDLKHGRNILYFHEGELEDKAGLLKRVYDTVK